MARSRITGRSFSGRTPSGTVIRRELQAIKKRLDVFIGDRNLSGARSYLNSISGLGSFSQTNRIISQLSPRLSGNVRNANVRLSIRRDLETVFRGGLRVASQKTIAAKSNIKTAQSVNVSRGIKPKETITRRTQGGEVFRISPDGGFERIGLSKAEKERRARIRAGTSTAKDIIPRLQAGQKIEDRERIILSRTRSAKLAELKRKKLIESFGPRSKFLPKSTIKERTKADITLIAKLIKKGTPQRIASNLTNAQVNSLQARANAIEKRGERLNKTEASVISKINEIFKIKTQKTPTAPVVLPGTASKGNKILARELATFFVGTTALLPQRAAQVLDKGVFIAQVTGTRTLRGDFKGAVRDLLKASNLTKPDVQRSLREGATDWRTYVYSLFGAKITKKSPISLRTNVLEIAKPKPNSPTANAFKNRIIRDPKTKTLYYINKKAEVYRVSITQDRVSLILSKKDKVPIHKKLGFQTEKQYKSWLKLNEKSKVTSGNTLLNIEKNILKIENTIVSAKNRAVLQKTRNKLANLEKARKVRSSGKAPKKKPISKAAQKRAELAKSNLEKKRATQTKLQEEGFKNAAEKKSVLSQGFKNKKEFIQYGKLFQKATQGNGRATRALVKFEQKLRSRKGRFVTTKTRKGVDVIFKKFLTKAQKKGLVQRKKTIKLKQKIELARKGKKPRKATKKILKEIILTVTRGKKAQKFKSNIDQILLKIETIKKSQSISSSKFKLRTLKSLKPAVKYKLLLNPKIGAILRPATLRAFASIQLVPEILTTAYESKFAEMIENIFKQVITQLPKQKEGLDKKIPPLLRTKPLLVKRPPRRPKEPPKEPPKQLKLEDLPKPLFPQSVKNPRGYDVFIVKNNKYKRMNKVAYTKAGANKFGRWLTNNSLARSVKIVGVTQKSNKLPKFVKKTPTSFFRKPKKKSKLAPQTLVEKRKHAINTRGEKKGLRASQLLAKVSKRKKPKKRAKIKRKRPTKRK